MELTDLCYAQSGLTMPETLLLQEPLVYIPEETIREALKVILGTQRLLLSATGLQFSPSEISNSSTVSIVPDVRNQPVLIHCKRGKVITNN